MMQCIILFPNHDKSGWVMCGPYSSLEEAAFTLDQLCADGIVGRIFSIDEIATAFNLI